LNIILSNNSTNESSSVLVEMLKLSEGFPAGIVIFLLLTVYSSVSTAVPSRLNSIVISLAETFDNIALSITSFSEFSTITSLLSSNETVGGSLISFRITENESTPVKTAFVAVALKIIVSSNSSNVSSTSETLSIRSVSPALITI